MTNTAQQTNHNRYTTTLFRYVVAWFFITHTFFLNAQNDADKLSLSEVLNLLEERYQTGFSYANSTVTSISANLPDDALSLKEALVQLTEQTQLVFKPIRDDLVVVLKYKDPFTLQHLKEVVVTNYLTQGITKKDDGTTVLNLVDFDILPGLTEPDVLQIVQALPGVMSHNETISHLNIHGGSNDQSLILWNGIKMYQSGHFFGLISAFNPQLTQTVNVIKNGTSAAYGDAVSGTIEMKNDSVLSNKATGGIGVNMIDANGYVKIPLNKKTELQLSSRRSLTDFAQTPTYDQYFKRVFQDTDYTNDDTSIKNQERFYFYDITGKLMHHLTPRDQISVSFLSINNKLEYQEQTADQSQSSISELSQANLAGGITYNKTWNDRLQTKLQAYATQYTLHSVNQNLAEEQTLLQKNEILETALKLNANYFINQNFNLNTGYHFTETGITHIDEVNRPQFQRMIKTVLHTHSGFAEIGFLSNKANTSITSGVRVNYFDALKKTTIEPRLSLSHRFSPQFRIEVLGEMKSQATSQIIDLQQDFLGVEKRRWVLANNDDIPLIKSKQASVGLNYTKNNWLFNTEAYYKKVTGISSRGQGFQNQFHYAGDTGEYTVTGVDVLLNKRFSTFTSYLSYTFNKNNYLFTALNDGKTFPNNISIRHYATFGVTKTLDNLKLAAGVNWHSGKPFIANLEAPNTSTLKEYLRVDASGLYTFKLDKNTKAVAGVSIWNVLNRKNIVNAYYTSHNDENSKVTQYALGFTPNACFKVFF